MNRKRAVFIFNLLFYLQLINNVIAIENKIPSYKVTEIIKGIQHQTSSEWKILSVNRTLFKQGFHRELFTEIIINMSQQNFISQQQQQYCRLTIAELINKSIYIDEYQISELYRLKQGPLIYFFDKFDLEKPTTDLKTTNNIIFVESDVQKIFNYSTTSQTLKFTIIFPIHARYHSPSSINEKYHIINTPFFIPFIQCISHQPTTNVDSLAAQLLKVSCPFCSRSWQAINISSQANNIVENTQWLIPVGSTNDAKLITIITFSCTITTTIIIIIYQQKQLKKLY